MIPPQGFRNPDPETRRCHPASPEKCSGAFVSRSRVLYPPQLEHALCLRRRKSNSGWLREKNFCSGASAGLFVMV